MKKFIICFCVILIIIVIFIMYRFNIIPHKKYSNQDFSIDNYYSSVDKDQDGIDDQTDILEGAYKYIQSKPKYMSKYYATGYPSDEYGVCTDVIGKALLNAGYDIMNLLNEDVLENPTEYDIDIVDKNIDFRRVLNLDVYFRRHVISLTTDVDDISAWQGGDIVVFKRHIGIISKYRNWQGIPFVIHHANDNQLSYEEDILKRDRDNIIGHYRIS